MKHLALLFLLSFSTLFAQQGVTLKDGDLLFQDMDCGPLCDAIEAVTEGCQGKDFSYMGMVYRRNYTIYIIEAAGNTVRLSTLEKFSKNTKKPMLIGRLRKQYRKIIPQAINFSLKQLGLICLQ